MDTLPGQQSECCFSEIVPNGDNTSRICPLFVSKPLCVIAVHDVVLELVSMFVVALFSSNLKFNFIWWYISELGRIKDKHWS